MLNSGGLRSGLELATRRKPALERRTLRALPRRCESRDGLTCLGGLRPETTIYLVVLVGVLEGLSSMGVPISKVDYNATEDLIPLSL